MDNKQTIIDNNARIDALTKRLNNSTFADVRDTTATASDVLVGKEFYGADGVKTTGTLEVSSGGFNGLQWVCDNVKSLYYEFQYYNGTSLDEVLVGLDTSKVTDMRYMFTGCTALTSIPQLDTSNVKDINYMFNGCTSLTTIPQLNIKQASSPQGMFYDCRNITTIPLLDMRRATNNLTGMFYNCTNLTNLTLKNVKKTLQIGSGTSYGTKLTDESIINTAQELWDKTGSTSQKLTLSTPSNARLDAIYVKLIDVTDEMVAEDEYIANKKPCVVCESTDTGAMTLREYIISKNWSIA